ncbi:MAG: carbohydrate binding domain-containing protein, partial [Patescibacteria group bacterium]
ATISLGVLLERNTQYRISLHPTNIKNSKGVSLGSLGTIVFTTADSSGPCQLNSLSLIPSSHIFTDNTQTQSYTALALDNTGNPIDRIPLVYDWTWAWSSTDPSVVGITDSNNDNQVATPLKNGSTTLKVVAEEIKPVKVGFTGTKEAQASVRVIFCDVPWYFLDDVNNCAANAIAEGCGINYNFDLFYCRGKLNGTLLPDFDVRTIRGQSGSVLKQFLFKESDPEKKDAIGLRIYANLEGLSAMNWYKQNIENPGAPQSLSVDGYQAVRDGRTVYVGATNIDYDVAPPQIYNNIYLISYNDEASSETINIFNQMLTNWHFNTNIRGVENKELIARDLNRINDLKTIVGYLESYRISHQEYKSENMALDPGFETNSNIPSANWITQGTPLEVSIATDEKYEGSRAVKISLEASNAEYAIQDMAVELGKTYEVSAWIKTNITGTGSASLLSQCRTPDNLNFNWTNCKLNKSTTAVTGVTDWVKRSVVVNANLADHILRIGCSFSTGALASGQAWCDNFQVREIASPYPSLTAGSYLSNMSTSRWTKSWQTHLGNDLGKTLPVDPVNNIICQGTPSDTNACWDEPTKTFTCLAGSHIYAYKTDNGMDYQLYANLEYSGPGNWITGSYLSCVAPSNCQCFNKLIGGP